MPDYELELKPASKTFLGCSDWSPEEVVDIVILGVPTDHGTLGVRSTVFGPSALRAASHVYVPGSQGEGGWYDYTTQRNLLRGIKLADAGDFPVDRRVGMQQFDILPSVIENLLWKNRSLVVLGGDDSILYWLAQTCSGRAMLILDSHEDATRINGEYPHHGNVVSFIDTLLPPVLVLQYGLRGIVPLPRKSPPQSRVICTEKEEVIRVLKDNGVSELAICVDVDVFNPRIVDAVCARSPGGESPDHMLPLFEAIAASGINVKILSITEFAPDRGRDADTALALVQFIIRALDFLVRVR